MTAKLASIMVMLMIATQIDCQAKIQNIKNRQKINHKGVRHINDKTLEKVKPSMLYSHGNKTIRDSELAKFRDFYHQKNMEDKFRGNYAEQQNDEKLTNLNKYVNKEGGWMRKAVGKIRENVQSSLDGLVILGKKYYELIL